MLKPRDYQEDAVQSFFDYYNAGNNGNPIIVAATGAGKSLILAELIRKIMTGFAGQRVIMATHVANLVLQNAQDIIAQYPNCNLGIYSAGLGKKQPWADVIYGGIQSMYKYPEKFGKRDLLFIDECFTGKTLISTNKGDKRIDKVGCGDIIYTATGFAKVVAKSVKTANIIYKVRLSNGRQFRVTSNHPILSSDGWTEVRNMEAGSEVFSIQDMPQLWKSLQTNANPEIHTGQKSVRKESFLLDILLKEARECNVDSRGKGEDAKNIKEDWTQACASWWKWEGTNRASKINKKHVGSGLDNGVANKDLCGALQRSLPKLLQGGFREHENKSSDRAGWLESCGKAKALRSEKRQLLGNTWMESIEIEESRGTELVYNLQTDGHPSYFANGILAHNCHLLSPQSDGMYTKFIAGLKKQNPYLKIVGLSATPWRQKGGSLINQEDAIFTDIIYDISLGYLIKRGYLTGLVGKSSIIQADLSGVKKIGGEFNLAQLEKAFDKEELTNEALDEVEKLAFDRKYFLFFCSGLDHCEHVAANLKDRGWECYTITGSTTQKRREFLLNKFRKSRTRIALINNTVLTTGTDLPNADCLVFLRGTQSSSLFVQICGRVARPVYADGYDLSTDAGRLAAIANGSKPSALILDYGGNIQRFGAVDLIEAPRSKSGIKSGEPTSPPQKICPNCREALHVTVRECHCGHIFDAPDRINHETSATTLAIMSTEMASTKHEIINTIYKSHVAKSGTPCLRVQYYDKMGFLASDYIPFSQFGNIRKMADEWFYEVTDKEYHNKLPRNTEEALAVKHLYNSPSFIHLRRKGKYSEIIKREYKKTLLTNNI